MRERERGRENEWEREVKFVVVNKSEITRERAHFLRVPCSPAIHGWMRKKVVIGDRTSAVLWLLEKVIR